MDGWIVIPNWRRFQHYKDRQPAWIKVYTELHSDADFLALSLAARGLLMTAWLEHARSRGQASTEQVARLCGAGFKHSQFKVLSDAGFITIVASKPLALVYQRASPEVEVVLRTTEKSGASAKSKSKGTYGELMAAARRFATDWNGGTSDAFDAGLDHLEETYRLHLEAGDRYRLWDEAIQVKH